MYVNFLFYNTSYVITLLNSDSSEKILSDLPDDGVYSTNKCRRDLVKNYI